MIFPLHKDNRGSFQELAHSDDVKFGQLSLLTVNPNCERGGHYHTYKEEWFSCIHGRCRMDLINVKDGTKRSIFMGGLNNEFVYIKPYESHIVVNIGENVCELLVIISEKYTEETVDTIKYKG